MFIIEHAIERSKVEILEDMSSGIVPTTVSSFSELHDYVDANEYGGLCESGTWWMLPDDVPDEILELTNEGLQIIHTDQSNAVQTAVSEWLQRRTACQEIGHKFEYDYELNYRNGIGPRCVNVEPDGPTFYNSGSLLDRSNVLYPDQSKIGWYEVEHSSITLRIHPEHMISIDGILLFDGRDVYRCTHCDTLDILD